MAVRLRCVWVASLCVLPGVLVTAQTPLGTEFTYQGQLNASGLPAIASADFQFSLFDAATGGAQIGVVLPRNNVALVNGAFTTLLDFGAAAFDGQARWLEVAVRSPAGAGGFTTLTPRQLLTATPNATYSLQTRGIAVDETGQVGIGTATPATELHVSGEVPALRIQDNDDPASFLLLEHSQPGQTSLNNVSGTGISFIDLNPMTLDGSGNAHLRFFRHTNTTGVKSAIFHSGNDTNATSAVVGVGGSSSIFQLDGGNFGIGTASPANRLSVSGSADFSGNVGIGTTTPGARLEIQNSTGNAVNAESTSGDGIRAVGFGLGLHGVSSAVSGGTGILGVASLIGGTSIIGVRGGVNTSDPNSFGVFSTGRLGASGTKSFRIDHPLDPQNKYLMHYCAEGPVPQNIYNGVIRTGADGYAWVELPAYCSAITTDFRYQLTVVDDGDDFVFAKVTREVEDNRFQIRTSRVNVQVCWEVKGLRNDLFVRTCGAPVEVEKPAHERGTYQHPELYGQPKEKGLNYRPKFECEPPTNAPHPHGQAN